MANPRNGANNNSKNDNDMDDSKSNATGDTELDNSMILTDNEEDEPLERSIPPEAVPVLPPSPPPAGGRYRKKRITRHKRKLHRRKSHRKRKTHRRKSYR